MMEYLMMTFFVVFVIIILVFFLSWWQLTQIGMEEQNIRSTNTIALMDKISNSPIFVQENLVFDDSRLQAMQSLGFDACSDLQTMFGGNWFIELEIITPQVGCEAGCTASNYPCCSSWVLCPQDKRNVSLVLPANVYRKAEHRVDLALFKAGVYE